MPIYTYRCTCGKTADMLVRGREPQTCDDIPELCGRCAEPGVLTRGVTAAFVGKGYAERRAPSTGEGAEACGHCGAPDSCDS